MYGKGKVEKSNRLYPKQPDFKICMFFEFLTNTFAFTC